MSQWSTGIPKENNGGVPVNLQDQHTEMVVAPLCITINSGTLLASPTVVDDSTLTLSAGHGASIGDILTIGEGDHFYWATILDFAGGANVPTVDSPLDYAFTTAALVVVGNDNLNAVGTLAAPITASLTPSPTTLWDITRIHVSIIDNVVMDSSKFGGIAGLTNGVVLRAVDGQVKNIVNVKSNGQLAATSSFYAYDEKAPAGVFGFVSNHVFGGQDHVGVTIRLVGSDGDTLEAIIQDDLSDLTIVKILAIGHVVTD